MRHIFNENIATHFAAFVQQKHKDGAEEGRGSQAVFLYLPFSQQLNGTLGRLALRTSGLPPPREQNFGLPLTPGYSLGVKS